MQRRHAGTITNNRSFARVTDYAVPGGLRRGDNRRRKVDEHLLDFVEFADGFPKQYDTEADQHLGEVRAR